MINLEAVPAVTTRLCWATKADGAQILLHPCYGTLDAHNGLFTTRDKKYTFPVTQNDYRVHDL